MNLPVSKGVSGGVALRVAVRKVAPSSPMTLGTGTQSRPATLPTALAFLTNYGVSVDVLMRAALQARWQGVSPEAALLANGVIRESLYYHCLAHRLGAQFNCGQAPLSDSPRYPYAVHAGLLLLEGDGMPR
jgi:hypothetical protein